MRYFFYIISALCLFLTASVQADAMDEYIFDYFIVHNNDGIRKYSLKYDISNRIDELLIEIQVSGNWINAYKTKNEYDNNDSLKLSTTLIFDQNKWENYTKNSFKRDAPGKLEEVLFERHDGVQYVPESKVTFSYDLSGNRITELTESFNDNSWNERTRNNFRYDETNNLIEELAEIRLPGKWDTVFRNTFAYNNKNKELTMLQERLVNFQYSPFIRNSSQYDESGEYIQSKLFERMIDSSWTSMQKYQYTYDNNNNFVSLEIQHWNVDKWENYARQTNKFNQGNYPTKMDYENWDGAAWYHGPTRLFNFSDSRGTSFSYDGYLLELFYVGETGIETGNNSEFYISPNPASDYIEISYPPSEKMGLGGVSVRIYNLLGTEVLKHYQLSIVNSQLKLDVSHLASGIYFVRVGDFVSKFVKY